MNEDAMPSEEFEPEGTESGISPVEPETGDSTTVMMSIAGYTFDTLVGYDEEIERLAELQIVEGSADPEFVAFVEQMKAQHGLYNEPTGRAVLFRSDVREDADRLMVAVANELGHPTLRMRVLEAQPGVQAICIMASQGVTTDGFEEWGTLVLEGVDQWGPPEGLEHGLSFDDMALTNAARGAMKAVSLIHDAAANPKVTVLASAVRPVEPGSLIANLLGPHRVFEIPAPSAAERDDIWDHLMHKHVSMSALDRFELVRLSEGMPRCDIFDAAREAVSEAYHQSLDRRVYVPVGRTNLLGKIAAYQPVDSDEYRIIEESAIEDFRDEIERFERGEF